MAQRATSRRTARPSGVARMAVAVLVAVLLGAAGMPGPSAAAGRARVESAHVAGADGAVVEGQRLESVAVFRIDPDTGVVHVQIDYTVTNTTPNRTTRDGIIQYYFDGLATPLEQYATNLAVTVGGRAAEFQVLPIDQPGGDVYLDISYGRRLRYRQTLAVTVTYDLAGLAPRSEVPARANAAYSAFLVYAFGDDGLSSVKVELPPGWDPEYIGDTLLWSNVDGVTTYGADAIADPQEFVVLFTARNDGQLDSSSALTAAGHRFEIQSWPGDTAWRTFVTRHIRDGLPALEELIGLEWPVDATTEVVEAYTPYLRGYAGWYDPALDRIEIGEDLDDQTVLHELAHAWLNRDWITERWITEGFAEELASKAVDALGGESLSPEPVFTYNIGAVRLNDWGNLADVDEDVESYGYRASFTVARALSDEIGMDKLRAVFTAADEGRTAYPGDTTPETGERTVDWRRFLDLATQYGGSTELEGMLRTWVTRPGDNRLLDERADARTRYQELVDAGDGWAVPTYVRAAMNEWRFADAVTGMDAATVVLAARDELAGLLRQIDVPSVPAAIEPAYEAATTDLDAVSEMIATEATAARAEIARREELRRNRAATSAAIDAAQQALDEADGVFEQLGLRGTDLAEQLDSARQHLAADEFAPANEIAATVVARVDEAERIGKERALKAGGAGLAVLLLAAALVILLVVRRRRRGDSDAGHDGGLPGSTAARWLPPPAPGTLPVPLPPPV